MMIQTKRIQAALLGAVALGLLMVASVAQSAPNVKINMVAEKVIETVDKKGKKVRSKVPAEKVEPGDEIIFTLTYVNESDESATDVKLNNAVPADTAYVAGSAWGENASIKFSADNAATFKEASLLTYEVKDEKGKKRKVAVSPDQYTNILWTISEVGAREKGTVGFKAIVE